MCHLSGWPWWDGGRQAEEGWICRVAPGVRAKSREGKVEMGKGQGTKKTFLGPILSAYCPVIWNILVSIGTAREE